MKDLENQILIGDCIERMKELPENSVDLIATDPPYGYSFMQKNWDRAVPSIETWQECLRVLKPGGFAFVMSAPRQDVLSQMIVRIGAAGFKTDFTSLFWTYASGFPKAMNIGKMVDKRLGLEREVIGTKEQHDIRNNGYGEKKSTFVQEVKGGAVSEAAKALDGSYGGFQPKPALEVIIVAMKPLGERTFIDQALKNRKGITWLDDGKIPGGQHRFPSNFLVSDDVLNDYSRFFSLDAWAEKTLPFLIVPKASKAEKNKGLEDFSAFNTSGRRGGSDFTAGGINKGATSEPRANHHPTVKPVALMSYLITLGSRPGDTVLDPFLGSGTTAIAAKLLKRKYLGIEREQGYLDISEARIKAWGNQRSLI